MWCNLAVAYTATLLIGSFIALLHFRRKLPINHVRFIVLPILMLLSFPLVEIRYQCECESWKEKEFSGLVEKIEDVDRRPTRMYTISNISGEKWKIVDILGKMTQLKKGDLVEKKNGQEDIILKPPLSAPSSPPDSLQTPDLPPDPQQPTE